MDLIVPKPPQPTKFWTKFKLEMARYAIMYPTLNAYRHQTAHGPSEWVFEGPYAAIKAFKDLAGEGAVHLGFHGTKEMSVQFFLDEMFGDHIIKPSPKPDKDDTLSIVTHQDGSREAFRGRQKVG